MPSFTEQKTRVKAVEGPQKCVEHQDRVLSPRLRKEKLSRGKACLEAYNLKVSLFG